jgi:hypothetical protein
MYILLLTLFASVMLFTVRKANNYVSRKCLVELHCLISVSYLTAVIYHFAILPVAAMFVYFHIVMCPVF